MQYTRPLFLLDFWGLVFFMGNEWRWRMICDQWNFSNDQIPVFIMAYERWADNWFICPGNIVTLLWFRVIWSYSDCWSLAWINFFSSPKGPWLLWIQHQLLFPLIEKQAPALWESRQGRVKSWVGDGTGRPWENGARHLDPPRLGMFLRVSAKGSWLRHRQRWAGVSR